MNCKVCGKELKYSKTGYCRKHVTQSPEHRAKNSAGVKKMHAEGRAKEFSSEERATGHQRQVARKHKDFLDHPNRRYASETLRFNLLYSGRSYKCEKCGIEGEWREEPISLEIDHIDGDRYNNRLENLRFLCPNCHSQTDTFRNRGGLKPSWRISDAQFEEALRKTTSLRQALLELGLSLNRDNFIRGRKIQARVDELA